jgi:molecular chaperone DnaK
VRRLTGTEPNKEVHPDEVVAVGAAIQAGVLAGDVREVVLLDVTPLSLGIETLGGVNTILIPRNTTIPTRKTETFSTAEDGQTAVDIHVVQGERPMARDNRTLGKFQLDGIAPAPRGLPQIEVTFDIDANGILNVSAKDKATGREQSIKITGTGTLDKGEVDRLVKDAEAHASEDQRRKDEAEVKNRGDSLAYQTERMLKEVGDKVPAEDRAKVDAALTELKEAVKSGDTDRIKRATEALQQASYKLGEEMYKRQTAGAGAGAGTGGGGQGGGQGGGDDVIDAEFKPSDKS